MLAAIKGVELGRIFSLKESDGIFEQACQLLAKGLPLRASVVFVHFGQFGEQMIETPLLGQRADLVVIAPEVADQNSLEQASQDVFDHRRAAAFGDQIIAELLGGETPQPVGDAIEPPAGLIGIQDRAGGDALADGLINGLKEPGEVFPGLGESAGRQPRADFHLAKAILKVVAIRAAGELERSRAVAEMKRLASFPILNPNPIVEVDVAGQIHFCNPTAERMLSDLYQSGLGHTWLADWESVMRTLREGGSESMVREVPVGEKWYQQTMHFVEEAERVRIYGADISERKKIEVALQKAYDEIEQQVEERTFELRTALSEIKTMKDQLEAENIYFREEINLRDHSRNIIGQSDALKYVLYRAEQVASANTTVLILGETGTGKDLIAVAIHNMSPRKERPLITVNCAVLPGNLIESELFGREKGAFTGADTRQVGRFEIANGSTLCLDEIGELPQELQAKLLRVIQHGEFERLGSSHTTKVDTRIVATTNRDLEEEVRKGRFRQDLYYRLNVFPITVPPLRQRKEDIPLLVEAFIARYARKLGKQITSVQNKTMKTLQDYPWPGNVRELESVIERAVILCPGPVLQLADKLEISSASVSSTIRTLEEVERNQIRKILSETRWRIEGKDGAAAILGLHPSTLRARMHKLGILRPKPKASV